ncbi:MAG: RNA polymerase sigma factor SigC [Chroococcidiopsidaceae cyanobacterium CP_BM_ER_R8_30]|nr:RNA polymerase sigma factor SigC [Chroococcidiopsidaceae cyanobacterium CP_BM_ER_R8_30]
MENTLDEGKMLVDALALEFNSGSTTQLQPSPNLRTTDLVRLYLQEIGRVHLLRRDEEISEAQKVQRYLRMRSLLSSKTVISDQVIQTYTQLRTIQERLVSQLGHRPSLERWADTVGLSLAELKLMLAQGKQRWADIAGLTIEELEQIQSEGIRAKEHMLKANLRMVVSVAKKYQNRGLEFLDLVQEGTLGLERAVEKFDPCQGYRFSTYAYYWIRQGMTRAIATQSRTIRLPVHVTERLNKIKRAQRKIAQEKGRTPTIEDIAQELEIPPSQVQEVLSKTPRAVSLEIKVGDKKDVEFGDLIQTDTESPEDALLREALHQDLQLLLAELNDRERDIILMRFGLTDEHPYSLAEIGRALNLSRERVRQIESRALQKLRLPKNRNRVRDYFESLR